MLGRIRRFFGGHIVADVPDEISACLECGAVQCVARRCNTVVERDLVRFGEALEEIQRRVGQGFAPAQGGLFAMPELESIAAVLRSQGLHGVGQSSWGPTLYGFSEAPLEERHRILDQINERLDLRIGEAFWTSANSEGYSIRSSVT